MFNSYLLNYALVVSSTLVSTAFVLNKLKNEATVKMIILRKYMMNAGAPVFIAATAYWLLWSSLVNHNVPIKYVLELIT